MWLSGIDLVDGTPIIDIKPYVASYDSVPSSAYAQPQWLVPKLNRCGPVQFFGGSFQAIRDACDKKQLKFYDNPVHVWYVLITVLYVYIYIVCDVLF